MSTTTPAAQEWDEAATAGPGALGDFLALAACTLAEPTLFFSDDMSVVAAAKAVCAGCPVREQCLAGALARREPHGVWGGELFENGVVIARKRPRGRPRKNPLPVEAAQQSVAA